MEGQLEILSVEKCCDVGGLITCSLSFPVLFPFCLSLFLCMVFVVGSVASQ
jgi:hypothetical protein